MTLDGKSQSKGAPFWSQSSSLKEVKEFKDILMSQLEKKADIYLMDEIGDRFLHDRDI